MAASLLGGRRADVLPGLLTGQMAAAGAPGPQFSPVEYGLNASALSGALSALALDRAARQSNSPATRHKRLGSTG